MSGILKSSENFDFIEGTRGLAALIVILGHYSSTFLPAFYGLNANPHFKWESALVHSPAFAFAHPELAVYIFFLMSGFVLAGSFLRTGLTLQQQVAKRVIRLFVPVVCSVLLACFLLLALPNMKAHVAEITGSSWLATYGNNPLTISSMAKDLFLSSMLMGYVGPSIFNSSSIVSAYLPLAPLPVAMNIPLWSLHIELWGSMLVLGLSFGYKKVSRPIFWMLFVALVVAIGANQFLLFLVGFVAYVHRASLLRFSGCGTVICSATVALAACFCFYSLDEQWLGSVISFVSRYTWLSPQPALFFRSQIAAVLFLLAVIINPVIRDGLSRPELLALGRLSFSLYLVHFPVLFTVGCNLFSILIGRLSYGAAMVVTSIVVGGITLILSIFFERLIDRRTVTWSKHLFKTA